MQKHQQTEKIIYKNYLLFFYILCSHYEWGRGAFSTCGHFWGVISTGGTGLGHIYNQNI